jgi:GTP:adenosylcobinamide-phosphate guanylyltransferase
MIDFTQRKTDSLVLAGGLNDEEMLKLTGETSRCFIRFGKMSLLEMVLTALRGSAHIGRITVVGNPEKLEQFRGTLLDVIIPEGKNLQENFFNGLKSMSDSDYILVSSADLPLISTEIIDNLLTLFSHDDSDIFYPIIPISVCDAKFPGGKRTVQKLREGEFTGGNIFMLNPKAILNNMDKIDRVIVARKNKKELVKLFGIGFVIKYLTHSLDIPGLEAKAASILGSKVKAIHCPHAEVGFDVDKPEDYQVALKVIRKRNGGS